VTLPSLPDIDRDLVAAFEAQLDAVHPDRGPIPARVIGYGEISTVLQIGGHAGQVYKRLAGFRSASETRAHEDAIRAYCDSLRQAGLDVVETQSLALCNDHGEHVLYLVQPRAPADTIGNAFCARADTPLFTNALEAVLEHYAAIWRRNQHQPGGETLGIDGQISNWAFLLGQQTSDPSNPSDLSDLAFLPGDETSLRPVYFDVGLPLLRRGGVDIMNVEIGLRTLPPPLAWVVRRAFLSEVLNRYYDLRQVLLDLVGNFYKEGYPDKIPAALEITNRFLVGKAHDLGLAPLRRKEVDAYYRRDAFIWRVFLGFRRLDRFVKIHLLRQRYPFILPGRIRR